MSGGPEPMDLRQVIHEFYEPVYRYAFRLTGSPVDAEDLVQETFLLAHARQHQLRDPDKMQAWLFGIVRGCVGKYYRRRRPVPSSSLELDLDGVPSDFPDEPLDVEELQAALGELPDDFRIVVLMFYFEELSYQQIAAELKIPMGTVMSRLARAKTYLRQRLAAPTANRSSASSPT